MTSQRARGPQSYPGLTPCSSGHIQPCDPVAFGGVGRLGPASADSSLVSGRLHRGSAPRLLITGCVSMLCQIGGGAVRRSPRLWLSGLLSSQPWLCFQTRVPFGEPLGLKFPARDLLFMPLVTISSSRPGGLSVEGNLGENRSWLSLSLVPQPGVGLPGGSEGRPFPSHSPALAHNALALRTLGHAYRLVMSSLMGQGLRGS